MQSLRNILLLAFHSRTIEGTPRRHPTWVMWAVATLLVFLAFAVPLRQSVSAQTSPVISLTLSNVQFETATATIAVTDVTYDDWVMSINYNPSSGGDYGHTKRAGPGLGYTPQDPYTFSYTFDSTADTIDATVTLNRMKPDTDYTVKVTLYPDGKYYKKVVVSDTLTTSSGCTPSPNPGANEPGWTTRPSWFGIHYTTGVTETELMMVVTVTGGHAPLNSGRCVYFRYREYGGSGSGILTAYVHSDLPGGSRGVMIDLPDLDPNTEELKPGTRYSFTVSVDENVSEGNVGIGGTTLGENTGISGIDISNVMKDSADATATIRNASTDDKIVYMRHRTSPVDAEEEDKGYWSNQDPLTTKGSTANFDLDYLDAEQGTKSKRPSRKTTVRACRTRCISSRYRASRR